MDPFNNSFINTFIKFPTNGPNIGVGAMELMLELDKHDYSKISEFVQKASDLKNLQTGDLLEFERDFYYHWAVYEGCEGDPDEHGTVIHFDGEPGQKSFASIRRNKLSEVIRGCRFRINNSFDKHIPPFDNLSIIDRAIIWMDSREYHVFANNCEHFATWCRNGECHSLQSHMIGKFMIGDVVLSAINSPFSNLSSLWRSQTKHDCKRCK